MIPKRKWQAPTRSATTSRDLRYGAVWITRDDHRDTASEPNSMDRGQIRSRPVYARVERSGSSAARISWATIADRSDNRMPARTPALPVAAVRRLETLVRGQVSARRQRSQCRDVPSALFPTPTPTDRGSEGGRSGRPSGRGATLARIDRRNSGIAVANAAESRVRLRVYPHQISKRLFLLKKSGKLPLLPRFALLFWR